MHRKGSSTGTGARPASGRRPLPPELRHRSEHPNEHPYITELPAYTELMRRFDSEVDWTAFIDADEFVWSTSKARTAPSLASLAIRPEIGAPPETSAAPARSINLDVG